MVGTVTRPQASNWKDNDTFLKKLLTYRCQKQEQTIVGTIDVEDIITLSNLFNISKQEVLDLNLEGYLAVEVEYRVLVTKDEEPSRSLPTEAGPSPEAMATTTFLRSVAGAGQLPLLRNK